VVGVAVRDDHEVDLLQIDAQRLYVVFEDPGVVAGVEQDAFAIVFDQGRKTPIQG